MNQPEQPEQTSSPQSEQLAQHRAAPEQGTQPVEYGQPVQGQPVQGQPVQGQPVEYGQPVQGQPVQGQPVAYAGEDQRAAGATVPGYGWAGAILAIVGGLLFVLSATTLSWFSSKIASKPKFSDLRTAFDHLPSGINANTWAHVYFAWLAWVLIVVAVVLALIGCATARAAAAARILAVVAAVIGVVLTFVSLNLVTKSGPGYSELLKQARLGFYFALAGFLFVLVGALIGPQRKRL